MPSARIARRLVAGIAATVAVLAMVATGVVLRTAGAGASATQAAVAGRVTGEPEPSTTTSSSTTVPATTSTTTPPTTTSTAVKVAPVPTTVPTTVPQPPVTAPSPPSTAASVSTYRPVAQPSGTSPEERCAAARQWVAEHGLALPGGWGFRCPGQAQLNGAPRWGMACWNCEGDGSSWIAVDVGRIGASDTTLRHVIAHEICHAHDFLLLGASTEVGADLCAALHGAPRP